MALLDTSRKLELAKELFIAAASRCSESFALTLQREHFVALWHDLVEAVDKAQDKLEAHQ